MSLDEAVSSYHSDYALLLHSLSTTFMSSSSHPTPSSSQFQVIFDGALREYAKKTGKDLTTHPLATSLEACDTPDRVLGVLRDQAHAFNQFRNGDWKVQLMRRLRPTIDILLVLSSSGVLDEGIGLVKYTILMHFLLPSSNSSCRNSHLRKQYLLELVSYSQCIPLFLFRYIRTFVTPQSILGGQRSQYQLRCTRGTLRMF